MRVSVCVGGSEALVHDLDEVWHLAAGRADRLTPAIFASRTLQSTPESGARADYDSAKCRQGSKVHAAVDTLGSLPALHPPRRMHRTKAHATAGDLGRPALSRTPMSEIAQDHPSAPFQDITASRGWFRRFGPSLSGG